MPDDENENDMSDDIRELVDFAEDRIRELVQGAREDVRRYAVAIVRNTVAVLQEPPEKRDALLKELAAQTLLLAEVQRLRASNASWAIIDHAIQVGINLALKAIDTAL